MNLRGIQATKVLKLLSSICEWSIRNGSSAIRVAALNDRCRLRTPMASNLGLRPIPSYGSFGTTAPTSCRPLRCGVLRLAILIGRRISEIAGATRDDPKLDGAHPVPVHSGRAGRQQAQTRRRCTVAAAGVVDRRRSACHLHDFRGLIDDQMAALGIPTELRSRTLHHTGDLQQLANTVYSAYDFLPERLRALELWEARLIEIVEDRKPARLRW